MYIYIYEEILLKLKIHPTFLGAAKIEIVEKSL